MPAKKSALPRPSIPLKSPPPRVQRQTNRTAVEQATWPAPADAQQAQAAQPRPPWAGPSAFRPQQAFAAASNQFAALLSDPPKLLDSPLRTESVELIDHLPTGIYAELLAYNHAVTALAARAAELGDGPQDGLGDVSAVPGGYFRHFANHDLYATGTGPAVEVHGDIRAKYNALGGASGALGMPITDEQGTPDGAGRYNHFQHGSIYWTAHTGPMAVRGKVRDRWASTGWEQGPFGYPVQDQHRMILTAPTGPLVEWCRFENGVIAGDANTGLDAPAALLTYAELGELLGAQVNAQFQASPDNVGLHAGVELTGVGNWQYGFWSSLPRSLGFRLRGFHDNGLAPDTDFSINLWLHLELAWAPTFTEPTSKTLVAVLDFLRVIQDDGPPVFGGKVIAGVTQGIYESFYPKIWPDPQHPEVPLGALYLAPIPTGANLSSGVIDVLDVLVSAAGELQLLVNPLAPPLLRPGDLTTINWGLVRQILAQTQIDALKAKP